MNNKTIALFERDFIGGTPKVERFENDDKSKSIDILSVKDGYLKNRSVYATIGFHKIDLNLNVDGLPLRTELVFATKADNEMNKNIIASAAFEAMDMEDFGYGSIIKNIIPSYIMDTEIKHLFCMTPVFWKDYQVLRDENEVVSWLQLVPISNSELEYIEMNGIKEFDKLLEKNKVDITRLRRDSVV